MRVSASTIILSSLLSGTLVSPASGQTGIRANEWSRGTTLNGFAGIGADSSDAGAIWGGAAGWEVTPRLAIEGSGTWLDLGQRTSAFAGALKVRVRLSGRRTVDPFVHGGIGLYRASFGPGESIGPDFYRRRAGARVAPGTLGITFTDPTVLAGGGLNIFLSRHFALRPDIEATFVVRDRRTLVVTSAALHAVYHFESHPVTPAAGPTGR